jgi:hypothetical protein
MQRTKTKTQPSRRAGTTSASRAPCVAGRTRRCRAMAKRRARTPTVTRAAGEAAGGHHLAWRAPIAHPRRRYLSTDRHRTRLQVDGRASPRRQTVSSLSRSDDLGLQRSRRRAPWGQDHEHACRRAARAPETGQPPSSASGSPPRLDPVAAAASGRRSRWIRRTDSLSRKRV